MLLRCYIFCFSYTPFSIFCQHLMRYIQPASATLSKNSRIVCFYSFDPFRQSISHKSKINSGGLFLLIYSLSKFPEVSSHFFALFFKKPSLDGFAGFAILWDDLEIFCRFAGLFQVVFGGNHFLKLFVVAGNSRFVF